MSIRILLFVVLLLSFFQSTSAQNGPERAILFIIDGLHTEAPERLKMRHFSRLARQGVLIEKTTAIMPYHPTHGEYARVHTCSYPNPVLMSGTIFLEAGQPMIQDRFESSAFVANTSAYQSITEGYDYVIQRGGSDASSVNRALDVLREYDVQFMRVHLQDTGGAGSESLSAPEDRPYHHNIWHEEAPYVRTAEEADRQLGRFISELKKMGKWENTLLVVTSDHGQTKSGWHPTLPEESWFVPTVFYGPGVKENRTIDVADHTDLIPTIAAFMGVSPPNEGGGSGEVLHSVKRSGEEDAASSSELAALNRVMKRYIQAEAQMLSRSDRYPFLNSLVMRLERDFYGLNRIMEWEELGSIDALIEHNMEIVREMEERLAGVDESG